MFERLRNWKLSGESLKLLWKETWMLKDDKELTDDGDSFCKIVLGDKEKTTSLMNQNNVFNWKSSIDVMYSHNPTHLITPRGLFSASVFVPMIGLRASHKCYYPLVESNEVELEYLYLKHWSLRMKLPLHQSPARTIALSATSRWGTYSIPFGFEIRGNLAKGHAIANWSAGFTRETPNFSYDLGISQTITEKKETVNSNVLEDDFETRVTGLCKVKSPNVSASASWNQSALKCSYEHKDGDLRYISEANLNFKEAKTSVCSVGLRKQIDEEKAIQVAFDTNNVSTIIYSYDVDQKLKFEVLANVDARDINQSHIRASFTFK